MKIVKYLGQEFTVPDCSKFIAADADGTVVAFEHLPVLDGSMWVADGFYYVVGSVVRKPHAVEAIP